MSATAWLALGVWLLVIVLERGLGQIAKEIRRSTATQIQIDNATIRDRHF